MDLGRRSFIKGASMVAVSVPAVAAASVAPASTTLHETDVQAAGTAAALCVKTGATPRSLDATALAKTLKNQGVFLG